MEFLAVNKKILDLFSDKEVKVLVAQLFLTLCEAMDFSPPGSMECSRQEYWSGLPFPSPGHLPNPGMKPLSLALQPGSLPAEPPEEPFHVSYS